VVSDDQTLRGNPADWVAVPQSRSAGDALDKRGKHLRPGLYRRFNPIATRDEAVATEHELVRRLRHRGYMVYGGH